MRNYSPAKQALDHNREGDCVRRWMPEFGTPAYPAPIVDARAALSFAQKRLYGLRKAGPVRQEAQAIQQQHGLRKSGLPNTTHRPARKPVRRATSPPGNGGQGELF